jgi:galactokinase
MMGGGFGGCTINLVQVSAIERFENHIRHEYKERTGKDTLIYVCSLQDGTHRLN